MARGLANRASSVGLALASVAFAYASGMPAATAQEAGATAPVLSTRQCAENWLTSQGLQLGYNVRSDGTSRLIASGEEEVPVKIGSDSWIAARAFAFNKARLKAMDEMIGYIRTGIDSGATLELLKSGGGGETSPDDEGQLTDIMTLPERAPEMQTAELDQELAKFDAGAVKPEDTKEQKVEKVLKLQSNLIETIKANAINVLNGVTVARQCEGPAEADGTVTSGRYTVSVTLVWSPKLAQMARSMFNPKAARRSSTPGIPLKDYFANQAAQDANWMAFQLGARVLTDENGEMVVVGFGAARASSERSADEAQADLIAKNFIAQFKAASLVSTREERTAMTYREYSASDSGEFLDASQFQMRVEEVTPHMNLIGVYPLSTWRGKHPISGNGMVVVARAWKLSAQTDAASLSNTIDPVREAPAQDEPAGTVDSPVHGDMPINVDSY